MNNAPTEYEVKFFPINLDDMRGRLQNAGAKIKTPERLMRRVIFAHEANPDMKCTYIRVRDEGNKVSFSAKQHATDGKMDSQKEYETTVDDFNVTYQILLNAGLNQTGFQENKRETWVMTDGTLVELETWPELPNYMEIEGASEEAVQSTAMALNLDWSAHIIESNDYLYAIHWGVEREVALQRLANITFDTVN